MLSTNRGNDLLIKLLKFRFPHIIDTVTVPVLRKWLNADTSERKEMLKNMEVSPSMCLRQLKHYIEENSSSFPILIGENWNEEDKSKMAVFLVSLWSER